MRATAKLIGIRYQFSRSILAKIRDVDRIGHLRFQIKLSKVLLNDLLSLEASRHKTLFKRVCILLLHNMNPSLVDKVLRSIGIKPGQHCKVDAFVDELLTLHDMRINSFAEDDMLNLLRIRISISTYSIWETVHAFWRSQRRYAIIVAAENDKLRHGVSKLATQNQILQEENCALYNANAQLGMNITYIPILHF